MDDTSFILKWRCEDIPEIRWFIRGIRQNGSFYGELLSVGEDGRSGNGKTVDGAMSLRDAESFNCLVTRIGSPDAIERHGWTGMLAEGPITAPTIRFYYCPGMERDSVDAERFLALIALLEPYMRSHYADLRPAIDQRQSRATPDQPSG